MAAFIQTMDAQRIMTTNGAACESTAGVGDNLVALFFKLVRGLDTGELKDLFARAAADAKTAEARADLFVLAFQTRGCRGTGKGEKKLFYELLKQLSSAFGDEAVVACLSLVPHFGCFKDLMAILESKPSAAVEARCLELYANALREDEAELAKAKEQQRTPQLSLAGKYSPRENGHYDKSVKASGRLTKALFGSNEATAKRKYRKLVSSLNAALNTTEVLMAAGRWSEIEFGRVASLCLQRHRKAFLNETVKGALSPSEEQTGNRHPDNAERVAARAALRQAIVAKKGVRGKALMPHEIASKLMHGRCGNLSTVESDLMDAQWRSMREGVVEGMRKAKEQRELDVLDAVAPTAEATKDAAGFSLEALKRALPKSVDLGKLVPLVDVSGSMSGRPMEVAISMGILVSELTLDAFKDRLLTFESSPSWVSLSHCRTIGEKVAHTQSAGWGGSTNFEAACERILEVVERAKLSPDEVPDLICFSDMQFDAARGSNHGYDVYGYYGRRAQTSWETQFERLERRFDEVGRKVCGQPYAAPRIIFWNLDANTVGFPAAADAPNCQMLSGFSPALLKLVLTGADLVGEEEEVLQPDGTVKMVKQGPTPAQTTRAALDDPCFVPVRLKLSDLDAGPLKEYRFSPKEEEVEEEVVVVGAAEHAAEHAAGAKEAPEVVEGGVEVADVKADDEAMDFELVRLRYSTVRASRLDCAQVKV